MLMTFNTREKSCFADRAVVSLQWNSSVEIKISGNPPKYTKLITKSISKSKY
jgi:hypothetical protein